LFNIIVQEEKETEIFLFYFVAKKDTPLISRKILIIIGSVFGCGLLFFFLCCLCGTCHQDRSKYNNKTTLYHKDSKF